VVPKVGVEIQTREAKGQKGSRLGGPNQSYLFQRCHCLSVSVCTAYIREKSRLLVLKTNLDAGCSPSSDLGRTQAWEPLVYIAILAYAVSLLNPLMFK